jgi:polyisoprenoid-binding protein YceI
MKRLKYLLPLFLALAGCQWFEHGVGTRTGPTPAPGGLTVSPVRPGAIRITPACATIEFTGSTNTLMSQTGHFTGFEGTLEMPTDDPKDAKIRVAIDMTSVTSSIWLLTKHLKGEDFFDVARYPTAEFTSDHITPTGVSGKYDVVGRLALHGVQKPIAFPARITVTPEEITFEGTLTIRQTEFGMTEAASKTKDEVPVHVWVRGPRN